MKIIIRNLTFHEAIHIENHLELYYATTKDLDIEIQEDNGCQL